MAKYSYEFGRGQMFPMKQNLRQNGDDNKTWVLAYGDSITDGFGASNMEKIGYTNLLKESLRNISGIYGNPNWGFDLVKNSAGFRCVNKQCDRPLEKDKLGLTALKLNVSAVIVFIGTNDCKNYQWSEANFSRDYINLL